MRKEATALSRAKVLRPILEIEEQGFPVSCALEDAAHDLGLSKSHTWRLYRRMKANDARSSALDLQRRGPKKGTRRLSGEVEQIIECSLRQYFLVRERPMSTAVQKPARWRRKSRPLLIWRACLPFECLWEVCLACALERAASI